MIRALSYMIIDGQWGSTGKGLISGYLARVVRPDLVVCNFGPNAGHTYVFSNDDKVMVQQLPVGIVAPSVQKVLIGPGSVIDPTLLKSEGYKYRNFMIRKQLMIHPNAAIVRPIHKEQEKHQLAGISSTAKGTGAALADKIMRTEGAIARDCIELEPWVVTHDEYMKAIYDAKLIQIESAQGMELGVSSGFHYPHCTSRDVTTAQVMADTLVPMSTLHEVILSLRTFPIRVGHQLNESGEKIGDSGPVYPDQREITFEELGVPEERTTVTNKVRRIFTFSEMNYVKALWLLQPTWVFLNFINYLDKNAQQPNQLNQSTWSFVARLDELGKQLNSRCRVKYLGFGPHHHNVFEI